MPTSPLEVGHRQYRYRLYDVVVVLTAGSLNGGSKNIKIEEHKERVSNPMTLIL
jgi:hypothetical protein